MACSFIATQCRPASRAAHEEHKSGQLSTARISCFALRTMASAEKARSMQPSLTFACFGSQPRRWSSSPFPAEPCRMMHFFGASMSGWLKKLLQKTSSRYGPMSVPRAVGASADVQRQRWFTLVDPDAELIARSQCFAKALASIPRSTAPRTPASGVEERAQDRGIEIRRVKPRRLQFFGSSASETSCSFARV